MPLGTRDLFIAVLKPCNLFVYGTGGRPSRWCSILGGNPSQECIDSSQIESLGGEKAEVSNAPTATPQTAGLRSPSQQSVLPQFGQK
jgi:hypothetical protein